MIDGPNGQRGLAAGQSSLAMMKSRGIVCFEYRAVLIGQIMTGVCCHKHLGLYAAELEVPYISKLQSLMDVSMIVQPLQRRHHSTTKKAPEALTFKNSLAHRNLSKVISTVPKYSPCTSSRDKALGTRRY